MDDPVGRWLLIVVFCLMTFICKMLSAAMVHFSEARLCLHMNKKEGAALKSPESAKVALSLLRSFTLLMLNALCVFSFAHTRGQLWLVVLILTPINIVPLKLVPSALGKRYADAIVAAMSGLLNVLAALMRPFTYVTQRLTRLITSPFSKGASPGDGVTEEEIRAMVDIGQENGAIEGAERDMIENVFDFGDMTAADCMTHRTDVTALQVDMSEEEVTGVIEQSGLSRFPVYDEDIDDVVGVLFARDYILNVIKQGAQKKPLRDLLRDPYFVPDTVKADTLLRNMQHTQTHMAIVVDEYGGVCGLVTMEDLLEEIVGDIYDEFDAAEEADVKQIAPDTYRISGWVTLEELNETFGISLSENDDYDTLGGLFLSRFNEIPEDFTTPEADVYLTEDLKKPEEGTCDMLHIKAEHLEDRRLESAIVTYVRAKETEE